MKRYKLLKDLPTFNAGDEFELRDDGCLYYLDTGTHLNNHWKSELMAYHRRTLKRFPNILNDWFEEIEEPKEDGLDNIITLIEAYSSHDDEYYPKEIVEKLKAWKRLKDKGFRFGGHDDKDRGQLGDIVIYAEMPTFEYDGLTRDELDLLFGGEE